MKNFIKNTKGITLIALIITIIVLLILAAVTINIAMQGGLIGKAKTAADQMQKQADREELLSAIIGAMDYSTGKVIIGNLIYNLGTDWEYSGNDFPYTFTKIKTGNSFLVYENGTIEKTNTPTPTPVGRQFSIELAQGSITENSIEINIIPSNIITFNSADEAYAYLYNTLGLSNQTPLSTVIETMYLYGTQQSKSYDEIKTMMITSYNMQNPTDEELIKALIVRNNYNNYTFAQALESAVPYYYVAQNREILVDGVEVTNVTWSGYNAKIVITSAGTHTIVMNLDDKTASNQITIQLPEVIERVVGDFSYHLYPQTKTAQVQGLSSSGNSKIQDQVTELTMPNTLTCYEETYTITSIRFQAFMHCTNLDFSSLPDELTSIEHSAFNGCTNLTLSSLPSGLTTIESNTFYSCASLALESLPSGLTTVGEFAFENCTSLELDSLPSGVASIGRGAFEGCTNLNLNSLPNGITTIEDNTFSGCTSLELDSLPSGITTIKEYAFEDCTNLALESLPSSLTSIGKSAFWRCKNLELSNLPNELTSIGEYAFFQCYKITLTSLPEGIVNIGNGAFEQCTSITQLDLRNCTNLSASSPNYPWGLATSQIRFE